VPDEHQIDAVKTVLNRMRGRALLADEIGRGKTVEAGIVLSELLRRRLVRRVLVLVPPGLVAQWQEELRRKFSLDFVTHDAEPFRQEGPQAWRRFERVASFRDKLLVFTRYRATQEHLARGLGEAGHATAVYHGGLRRQAKEAAVRAFAGAPRS
jgi:SNF2 family DNA or RNA helicase